MTASYLPTSKSFFDSFLYYSKHLFRYCPATDNNNISCMHHYPFFNTTIHFPIPPSIFYHLYLFFSNTTNFPTTLLIFQHHHTFYNATTHVPSPLPVHQHHCPFFDIIAHFWQLTATPLWGFYFIQPCDSCCGQCLYTIAYCIMNWFKSIKYGLLVHARLQPTS